MGWAARANGSAEKAKANGYQKPRLDTWASRHDAKVSRIPLAVMLLGAFGMAIATHTTKRVTHRSE